MQHEHIVSLLGLYSLSSIIPVGNKTPSNGEAFRPNMYVKISKAWLSN